VAEDPELIIHLLTHAMAMILDLLTPVMAIQDKYEVTSNPSVITQAPHSGVYKKEKYEVSHGKE
ncbi:hypothetical protein KI387_004341, partial [Taxus chinensis]